MLVPEPTLLLGKVKHFQVCCVSAQGVQGSCHPSQWLGRSRHPAHSHLSLSPQLPWPKCCWMEVCSTVPCGKGQFPTAKQTDKAGRTTEQFKKVDLRNKFCFGYCFISNNWPYCVLHSDLAQQKSAFSQGITLLRKLTVCKGNDWGDNFIP